MSQCCIRVVSDDERAQVIKQNYENLIENDWEIIEANQEELQTKEEVGDDEYSVYLYLKVHKDTLDVSISAITDRQLWGGESQSEYWAGNIMIFKDTTKEDLLEFDLSDNCQFYEDRYDKHLAFEDYYIPVENVSSSVEQPNGRQKLTFEPRGLFAKPTAVDLASDCFSNLDEKLGDKILIIRNG